MQGDGYVSNRQQRMIIGIVDEKHGSNDMEKVPQTVTAVYSNGVLCPLTPVSLKDGETVSMQIWPSDPKQQVEQVLAFLVDRGVLRTAPKGGDVEPISEEKLREMAARLGAIPGKPLSEIIIEDRR